MLIHKTHENLRGYCSRRPLQTPQQKCRSRGASLSNTLASKLATATSTNQEGTITLDPKATLNARIEDQELSCSESSSILSSEEGKAGFVPVTIKMSHFVAPNNKKTVLIQNGFNSMMLSSELRLRRDRALVESFQSKETQIPSAKDLFKAVEQQDEKLIHELLKQKRIRTVLETRDLRGNTVLFNACINQNIEIIQMLLEAGANANAVCSMKKQTPLHIALRIGNLSMAVLLLQYRANPRIKDTSGKNPIEYSDIVLDRAQNNLSFYLIQEIKKKMASRSNRYQDATENQDKENNPLNISDHRYRPRSVQHKQEISVSMKKHLKNENRRRCASRCGPRHFRLQSSLNTTCVGNTTAEIDLEDYSHMANILEKIEDLPSEPTRRNIRKSIDSYCILNLLGKGSFGEVYLVADQDTKELLAMKVFQKEKIFSQNLIKYTVAEKNIMSSTHFPFIVRLRAAFQTKHRLFLIMDYCPGGDLSHYIRKYKRFSEERTRYYLSEVILALEHLHDKGIIFRDLKPENIVLDGEGHIRLTDFGLSKEGMKENMMTQSFCGSLAYLAPEIIKRTGHCRSIDWYLLGILMYEMLVGIPPYYSNIRSELFQNIVKAPLKIPSFVSPSAKALITALLDRNPLTRLGAGPEDAQEIKTHPFFATVDWKAVLQKRMCPPTLAQPKLELNSTTNFVSRSPEQDEGKEVENWTYVESSREFKKSFQQA